MRHKFLSIFVLLSLIAPLSLAHAQLAAQQDPLNFIIAPETPGPNQQVQIEVQGVGPFLGNSIITWTQDGQVVEKGIGKTTYSFTTGGVGSATQIQVQVMSSQGTYERTYTFAPSVVEMLWEANTSVPLFYAGKPLFSSGSMVKVIAYPVVASGKSIVPISKLSYQWSLDSKLDPQQSGIGKNTFLMQGNILHTGETASVDIYLNGTKVAQGTITIPFTNPMVLMYNKDPLRGEILDEALPSAFSLGSSEITLQAEPYYFSNSSKQSGLLSYTWSLNNQNITGPYSSQGILTLRQSGQGQGAASLNVSVQNTDNSSLLQQAETQLSIIFGTITNPSSAPLFGI